MNQFLFRKSLDWVMNVDLKMLLPPRPTFEKLVNEFKNGTAEFDFYDDEDLALKLIKKLNKTNLVGGENKSNNRFSSRNSNDEVTLQKNQFSRSLNHSQNSNM